MADTGKHGELTTTNGIHIAYQWAFADSTARAVTTNPLTGAAYQAIDVGKFARQLDDNSVWMLTATTPTWVGVSANSAVSGLTAGRVVFVDTDGSLVDDSGLKWDSTNSILYVQGGANNRIVIDGYNGANLELQDNGAAVNTKRLVLLNESGVTKYRIEKDAGGIQVDNIFVIDNVTGAISIGTATATTGAQLDVAGDIVVSDGAGGEIIKLDNAGTILINDKTVATFASGAAVTLDDVKLHLPFTAQNNYANLNGHLGQAPTTATGSIVGFDGGVFGSGMMSTVQGFTNKILNPVVELGTTNLQVSGAGTSMTPITNDGYSTNTCVEVVLTANNWFMASTDSVVAGATYTVSAMVKFNLGESGEIRIYDGITEHALVSFTGTGEWELVGGTTAVDASATAVKLMMRGNPSAGRTFRITDMQLTQTSFQLPFRYYGMNGVTGSSGAVSVVTQSELQYTISDNILSAGTIMMWFKSVDGTGASQWLVRRYQAYGRIYLALRSDNRISWILGDYTNESLSPSGVNYADNAYHHVAVTWSGGTKYMYIDGVLVSTTSYTNFNVADYINVGGDVGGVGNLNGELSDFVITGYAMTATDIKKIYDSGVPINVSHSTHELSVAGTAGELVINEDGMTSDLDVSVTDLTASGTVLVNTTTATTGAQLDVAGDIVVSDGAGGALYSEDGSNTLKSSGGIKEYRIVNHTKALGSPICVISITTNVTISIEMSLVKFTNKFASEEYVYDSVSGVITQQYINQRISRNIDFNFVVSGTDIEIYLQNGAGSNIELTTNNVIDLKMMIAPYTSHTSVSVTW